MSQTDESISVGKKGGKRKGGNKAWDLLPRGLVGTEPGRKCWCKVQGCEWTSKGDLKTCLDHLTSKHERHGHLEEGLLARCLEAYRESVGKKKPRGAETLEVEDAGAGGVGGGNISNYVTTPHNVLSTPYKPNSVRLQQLRNAMAAWVASSSTVAYRTVENAYFQRFIQLLDPKFRVAARRQLTQSVKDVGAKLLDKILCRIRNIDRLIVVMDLWTARNGDAWLGFGVNYYDPLDKKPTFVCLPSLILNESHTAVYVMQAFAAHWKSLGLDGSQIWKFVVDGASNLDKGLREDLAREFIHLEYQGPPITELDVQSADGEEEVTVLSEDGGSQQDPDEASSSSQRSFTSSRASSPAITIRSVHERAGRSLIQDLLGLDEEEDSQDGDPDPEDDVEAEESGEDDADHTFMPNQRHKEKELSGTPPKTRTASSAPRLQQKRRRPPTAPLPDEPEPSSLDPDDPAVEAAIEELQRRQTQGLPLRWWCFLHRLNLVVRKAFADCQPAKALMDSIADFITHFKGRHLGTLVKRAGGTAFKMRMPVRWTSELDMVKSLVNNRAAIQAVLSEPPRTCTVKNFSVKQWKQIESVYLLLEEIRKVTVRHEHASKPTMSFLLKDISSLKKHMDIVTSNKAHPSVARDLAKEIRASLVSRFKPVMDVTTDNFDSYPSLAAYLDPQFRDTLSPARRELVKTTLLNILTEEAETLFPPDPEPELQSTEGGGEEEEEQPEEGGETVTALSAQAQENEGWDDDTDAWADLGSDEQAGEETEPRSASAASGGSLESTGTGGRSSSQSQGPPPSPPPPRLTRLASHIARVENQLRAYDTYIFTSFDKRTSMKNPLQFWDPPSSQLTRTSTWTFTHPSGKGNLKELALTVLSTPPSSASAERVFSAMGLLLNGRRNRLSPECAAAETLLQMNTQFLLDHPFDL